ncbi:hypothetical protein Blue_126 [Bacillus phage Deep Blue]|uniref:Uncharacterized protein n=1 Tax=Bacillus phage Deep Blue TaxID=1792245 RepID=A0A140HLT7_9CAUD|nr:hypothetical protein Blue_126 [Bacillus phage Deep Blue]AMO25949.1 hypothetical protein Blue_126 [Bacillus phage Deep Blue]
MIRIQLFTSQSGKELFRCDETFYAWDSKGGTAQIPFTVCKEHVEDLGDNIIHVKDLSSVKFGGVVK